MRLSRRQFLATTAFDGVVASAPSLYLPRRAAWASADATAALRIERPVIDVLGKAANVFGITQTDGTHGVFAEDGRNFRAFKRNKGDLS